MSSANELIALLDVEAEEFAESTNARTTLGIAIRSGKKEGIVWAHDKNRQAALHSLVEGGGEPFGWIRVTDDGAKVAVESAPFDHFIDDQTARIALKRISRLLQPRLLDRIATIGKIKKVRYFEDPSGWLQ
jgi:hypothetical protein